MEKINYKKALGQNFIFDKNLLRAIASDGEVSKDDTVLEIGAGAGTLTDILCEQAKKVISFEIDKSLSPYLNKVKEAHSNLELHFEDFMKYNLSDLTADNVRVVANIPYYITTPIIFKLTEHKQKFKSILVLIQKEVAERFEAKPHTKMYGITSVMLQAVYDICITRIVKKENFTPPPKIDSALCKLVPHNKYKIADFEKFSSLVHLSFSMRRKTLINNLKAKYEKEKLEKVLKDFNYSLAVRPEEISVEDYIKISKIL